ncbi:MAG: prepilin-type N-terminal cleavage/methylation domain-containing protein [Pyrinomonadaceae bacterium]
MPWHSGCNREVRLIVSALPASEGKLEERPMIAVHSSTRYLTAVRPTAGFSLIELLITVAIIGIIAAIAIPNLLASRRAANEGSAQYSLRTIHSCEITYFATIGASTYADISTLRVQLLTDQVLGSGTKSGYAFVANPTAPNVQPALYYATAVPVTTTGIGRTGTRRFGVTEDGAIRGDSVSLTPYADEAAVKSAPGIGN